MISQLKQDKYYFDQTLYPEAESLARQAQALFPSIRFGVGSRMANANFSGDESAILAALSLPASPPQPIKAPQAREKNADIGQFGSAPTHEDSAPAEPIIEHKEGDIVLVTSLGIEGKIKSVLPSGIVNVELADGITETMLAKNVEPVQRGAANTANAPPGANENTPPAPPKVSTEASLPPPEARNQELETEASLPPPQARNQELET